MYANFRPDFLWGATTAAFQIEGALAEDARGVSIWDHFVQDDALEPVHGASIAADHYHRLDEDLDLIGELGLNAYRFSIAWPRVMPTGGAEVNRRGLDFYRRVVDGLRERGIAPVVTVSHFDLPQVLEDAGGWAVRDTAKRLGELAHVAADALGDAVEHWITINDPWAAAWLGYGTGAFAPGRVSVDDAIAATHHQLLGHAMAMQAIRDVLPSASVGLTLGMTPVRTPGIHPEDRAVAAALDASMNRMCLEPLLLGNYPPEVLERYRRSERGLSSVQPNDLALIHRSIDFLGLNFYYPRMVVTAERAAALPADLTRVMSSGMEALDRQFGAAEVAWTAAEKTGLGWPVDPDALVQTLVDISRGYPPVPLIVTENGAAYDDAPDVTGYVDDVERISYLQRHLAAVAEAAMRGADIRGYFVWSLLDSFEWTSGLSERFGLIRVDPTDQARIPKASARWYGAVARAGRVVR